MQAAYAIGVAEPVAITVDTFGTGDHAGALEFARGFDFRPGAIIERLRPAAADLPADHELRALRQARPALGSLTPPLVP